PPIRDNVIRECYYGIDYRSNGLASVRIEGNEISQCSHIGITCWGLGPNAAITGDSVWNCPQGIVIYSGSSTITGNAVGAEWYVTDKEIAITTLGGVVSGNRIKGYDYGVKAAGGNPAVQGNTFFGRGAWMYPIWHAGGVPTVSGNVFVDSCYQGIAVSGSIGQNVTWDGVVQGDTWPYVVVGYFSVPSGRALTLVPGTVVKFDADISRSNSFAVAGLLDLRSTRTRPIYFTSSRDDSVGGNLKPHDGPPARGDWASLNFTNGDNVIRHCVLRYGGYSSMYDHMLGASGCSPTIDSCRFSHCASRTIEINYSPTSPVTAPPICDNVMDSCSYNGIWYQGNGLVQVSLLRNTILGTSPVGSSRGIHCYHIATGSSIHGNVVRRFNYGLSLWDAPARVEFNTVDSNWCGVVCDFAPLPVVNYNSISGNS
ncbi:MAG: hypothetical protein JSU73_00550, partial [candidate division WOR-3 bacterium]